MSVCKNEWGPSKVGTPGPNVPEKMRTLGPVYTTRRIKTQGPHFPRNSYGDPLWKQVPLDDWLFPRSMGDPLYGRPSVWQTSGYPLVKMRIPCMADYFFRSSIPTSYCMTQNYISHHIVQRLSGSSGPPRVRGGGGYPRAPKPLRGPMRLLFSLLWAACSRCFSLSFAFLVLSGLNEWTLGV